jgi:uncharacterized protein (TIGR03066 family)
MNPAPSRPRRAPSQRRAGRAKRCFALGEFNMCRIPSILCAPVVVVFFFFTTNAQSADTGKEPANAQKIVGIWSMVSNGGVSTKVAITYKFATNGNLEVRVPDQVFFASYVLDGNRLKLTFNGAKKTDSYTIKVLTEGKLKFVDDANGREIEFLKKN